MPSRFSPSAPIHSTKPSWVTCLLDEWAAQGMKRDVTKALSTSFPISPRRRLLPRRLRRRRLRWVHTPQRKRSLCNFARCPGVLKRPFIFDTQASRRCRTNTRTSQFFYLTRFSLPRRRRRESGGSNDVGCSVRSRPWRAENCNRWSCSTLRHRRPSRVYR